MKVPVAVRRVLDQVDGGLEAERLSLPDIVKAKTKPMAQKTPAHYGVDVNRGRSSTLPA